MCNRRNYLIDNNVFFGLCTMIIKLLGPCIYSSWLPIYVAIENKKQSINAVTSTDAKQSLEILHIFVTGKFKII